MLGDAVVELRRRAGLTQEALAERAGMSVRGLRKLESGQVAAPRYATMVALADALGLDERVRAGFIRGRGRLAGPPVTEGSLPTLTHAPRQLPPRLMSFVGRTSEVGILEDALASVTSEQGAAMATSVVTISGLPGVGKTALAVEWGHRVAPRFPDGQLYLNLRGFDPKNEPLTPDEALRVLMTSLGVPETEIRRGLDARIGQYRSLVAEMQILVILDNAADSDQVRPLLPAGKGASALVVSRRRLPGLVSETGAVPVSLEVLGPEESRELISRRLFANKGEGEVPTSELQPLVDLCAGLPLALALVASRAQLDPGTIPEYAPMVERDRDRLSVLASDDGATSFAKLLQRSLDGLSHGAQWLFVAIGVGASSEVSVAELASLVGRGRAEVSLLVDELADASLVQRISHERVVVHDLIWEYVVKKARHDVAADVATLCRRRLLEYLVRGSVEATSRFAPHRRVPDIPFRTDGVLEEHFSTPEDARAWMVSTLDVALVAVGHGLEWGLPREAAWLAEGLSAFLDIQGRWGDLLITEEVALRAGEVLEDQQIQALACRRLAIAHARVGNADDAVNTARQALSLYSCVGDIEGLAHSHRLVGGILEESDALEAALEHRYEALRGFEALGNDTATTMALNAVGWSHAQLGDFELALHYCTLSADMASLLGHSRSVAAAWDSIGFIRQAMADHMKAEAAYQRALDAWRDAGERYYLARTFESVAGLRVESGDRCGAVRALEEALDLFGDLGRPEADRVRKSLADLGGGPV